MAGNGFVGWMIILTVIVAFGVGFQLIRGRQRRRRRDDDVIECDNDDSHVNNNADKSKVIALTTTTTTLETIDGWSKVDLDNEAKF